jgi:hypothetical protein
MKNVNYVSRRKIKVTCFNVYKYYYEHVLTYADNDSVVTGGRCEKEVQCLQKGV